MDVLNHSFLGVAYLFGIGYLILAQQCFHAAIAFNRYTAFKSLALHKKASSTLLDDQRAFSTALCLFFSNGTVNIFSSQSYAALSWPS